MKENLINFSEEKRNKLQAMDERKSASKSDNFKRMQEFLTNETINDVLDALKIARQACDDLVRERGQLLTVETRQLLLDKASRLNDIYEQLNK